MSLWYPMFTVLVANGSLIQAWRHRHNDTACFIWASVAAIVSVLGILALHEM